MDGGRGQVSAAKEALAGTALADVPLFGMVKEDHHRTRAIVDSDGREIAINMNRAAQAAELDHNLHMLNLKTDSMLELTYTERKRVHNLKYYTWVEQQGMDVEDLNAQWYDTKGTWDAVHAQAKDLDALIDAFNDEVGILKTL